MTRQIIFNDLTPNLELQSELSFAFQSVLKSGSYLNGNQAFMFKEEWASYCKRKYCVLTASGLDALKLVLRAWGIGNGDNVYVPAWTCVQTWLAVEQIGAMPVPLENGLTETDNAIIQVHLYGALNDTWIGGKVLDDACQAHGLEVDNTAVYSFYPTKNLGCYGDGGAITTDDEDLYLKLIDMPNHSSKRLDEFQCAFLRVKLQYLNQWNEQRKKNAQQYLDGLQNVTLPDNFNSVWHQFVIRHNERDRLKEQLKNRGIETMVHYPIAPHRQLGYDYELPKADKMANEVLSLPVAPHLNERDVDYVIEAVNEFT